ncbi:MAG TPA: hypothetical protein VJA65_07050 [bacterium]|nr:hypothetical protein [bacterium]
MAPLWLLALLVGFLALASPASPQAEVRRDLTVGSKAVLGGGRPATQVFVKAHTEVILVRAPVSVHLTLDPGGLLDGSPRYVRGLTEAYVSLRGNRSVVSAGIERIPLEYARLTLPFSLERVDPLGTRLGRLGARLLWYPDEMTRVRFAVLDIGGRLDPLVSIRREFASFEIEAHVLHYRGRTVTGLGGSGLVGDLVVHGEVWMFHAPREWRYALGVSGNLGDGIWTVEGGYASEAPGVPPRHQLAAQAAWPLSEDLSITLTGRVFFDPDAHRGQVIIQTVKVIGSAEISAYLGGLFGPSGPAAVVGASVRISY